MSVKKEMLEQIALLEKGIALDYSSYLKAPTVIHNCEVEIKRANKEEKDEEVRNNIVRVHTEQIEENKKNATRSEEHTSELVAFFLFSSICSV